MQEIILIFGVFPLVFFIVATVFLMIGTKRSKKIRAWPLTEGEIIKKEKHLNISLSSLFNKDTTGSKIPDKAPTVRFKINNTTYESTSSIQQSPGFKPGTIVELYYNPKNPEETIINSFAQKGTVFKLLGWIFMSISIVSLIVIFTVYFLNL